jgi:hypothetical protein
MLDVTVAQQGEASYRRYLRLRARYRNQHHWQISAAQVHAPSRDIGLLNLYGRRLATLAKRSIHIVITFDAAECKSSVC